LIPVGLRDRLVAVLPLLLSAALTVALYAPALSSGFLYDDPLDLPRATNRSVLEILTDPGISTYYRPLPLLLWHALHALLGRNDPALLHGLALVCHAASGWLVYRLGTRLLGRGPALVALVLFVAFPPSYQVVGIVNAFFHALATLGVLAAAALYVEARTAGRPLLLGASLAAAGLALLSHESAVTIVPLILGLEVLLVSRRAVRPSGWPAPFILLTAAYGALYLGLPRQAIDAGLGLTSLAPNALFFLQGLASPVTLLVTGAPVAAGAEPVIVLAAGLTTVAGLLGLALLRRRAATAWFALAWFAAAVAPAALLLPWDSYVSNAPRLLYPGAAPASLLWAAAIGPRFAPRSGMARLSSLPAFLVGMAILGINAHFIAGQMRLQSEGADVVRQVISTAVANGPDRHATYVNLPSFFAPRERTYLLGHWGVPIIPQYVYDLGLVVAASEGFKPPLSSVAYSVLGSDWTHFYGYHNIGLGLDQIEPHLRAGGPVYLTRYPMGGIPYLEDVGEVERAGSVPRPAAQFDGWAALSSARAARTEEGIDVHLVWEARATPPRDFTIFIHLVDASGRLLAQADGYSLGGLLPVNRWRPGDRVTDNRRLPAVPGATAALVGMYDRADPARRAEATSASGERLPDRAYQIALASPTP
jgi:hypothetical protein